MNKWTKLSKSLIIYCCALSSVLSLSSVANAFSFFSSDDRTTKCKAGFVYVLDTRTMRQTRAYYGPNDVKPSLCVSEAPEQGVATQAGAEKYCNSKNARLCSGEALYEAQQNSSAFRKVNIPEWTDFYDGYEGEGMLSDGSWKLRHEYSAPFRCCQ